MTQRRLGEARGVQVFLAALALRLMVWYLIPVDWNWDSYHHWQISYLSLHVGFSQGRLWDLNGCEYLWGMVTHLLESALMWLLGTGSILPYRVLNLFLGSVNALLVYGVGERYFSRRTGWVAGLIFAAYPVACIFDVVAMQDTLALTLFLASLFLMRRQRFWSGLLLGLAGQSRVEFTLIGLIILAGVLLRERLETDVLPYYIGWTLVAAVFGFHLYSQTGDPFYSLRVSLLNVFGGFRPENSGRSFLDLMGSWLLWKLRVWPGKPTGLFLLSAAACMVVVIVWMARRRWIRYQPQLYFVTALAVLSPIFVTYIGSDHESLLIMLRMSSPIVALGSPLLVHASSMLRRRLNLAGSVAYPEYLVLILFAASFFTVVPAYVGFQQATLDAYASTDYAFERYSGGVVVCDYPTMNYRLVNQYGFEPGDLIGSHYAPDHYGVTDPAAYAEWLRVNNVTMLALRPDRPSPVVEVVQGSYPGVIVLAGVDHETWVYSVNQTRLLSALGE